MKDLNNAIDLYIKAILLNEIGEDYRKQGEFDEALEDFKSLLKILEYLDDFLGIATCLNNIGEIYAVKGENNKALKNYKVALEITEQLHLLS